MVTIGHTRAGSCMCTDRDYSGLIIAKPECPVTGHTDKVSAVTFSPDGKRVVTGSHDKLVKIWNAETGAEVSSFVQVR